MSWVELIERTIVEAQSNFAAKQTASQAEFQSHVADLFRRLQQQSGLPPKQVRYIDLDMAEPVPVPLQESQPSFQSGTDSPTGGPVQFAAVELSFANEQFRYGFPIWVRVGFGTGSEGITASIGNQPFLIPSQTDNFLNHVLEAIVHRLAESPIPPVKVGF